VASQWHPTKNGVVLPSEVSYASNKKTWWIQPYDDPILGHFDFEWEAKIVNRTLLDEKCPFIGNAKVWSGYNDLQTRFPEIAADWHPTKNGNLTPQDVVYGSSKNVWWMKSYDDPNTGKHFDFEWRAPINIRTGAGTNDGHQTGCPFLILNPKVWAGFNDLESRCPEIAKEWDIEKNRNRTPNSVHYGTTRKVWWKCSKCGREWYTSVRSRTLDEVGCPECRKSRNYFL
jgi:DNA-directed RNA polymerase subunit RPC12/RpoP